MFQDRAFSMAEVDKYGRKKDLSKDKEDLKDIYMIEDEESDKKSKGN